MSALIEELIRDTRALLGSKSDGGEVDTKFIKELVAAMKDLTAVIRNLNDLPTLEERFNMDIVTKRLELDMSKLGETQESGVTVTLDSEVEGWGG